jgi:glucosamine--fructose-6-phosphate aminotransferase (isomerizing)
MCGIFGFVAAPGAPLSNGGAQRAIRSLLERSEPRGREATGLAVVLPQEIVYYRRPMAPSRVLGRDDFQQFLDSVLPPDGPAGQPRAVIGHCRLVTNGSQVRDDNNQPVLLEELVGVHNGIVTNPESLAAPAVEGPVRFALDSEALFTRVAGELGRGADLGEALRRTYGSLDGEASIGMFARDADALVVATNTGSLYVTAVPEQGVFAFASEAHILRACLDDGSLGALNLNGRASGAVRQLPPGRALRVDLATATPVDIDLSARGQGSDTGQTRVRPVSDPCLTPSGRARRLVDRSRAERTLRRCSRCILPATYPFITFDADGVCNHCHEHVTQKFLGREALLRELDKYRRTDGSPDCIVAFSGGRDSSYGLHLLKTELGMTPIAMTYDWGLVTDLARRNQARICGKLGIEHVIRAADIPAQRRYIRRNIEAWLARPRLGMIPIIMAGDKFFYSHARDLRKETGIDLVVFCAGNELERTPFKAGFAGVRENNYSNRLFALAATKKLQLAAYYGRQFLANPRYFNESLVNSFRSFYETFVGVDDFLYLYLYEPWNEDVINRTLRDVYDWETSPESPNTWRIGDGYTAFINYVYFRMAGFSEFDAFRSHQVRDGVIDRETALTLAEADNQPRMRELDEFARLIGLNLEEVLSRIDEIPRLDPA